jgi:hypothetical protein
MNDTAAPDDRHVFFTRDRVELLATIMLAVAAIFTAWSAFESAKWSGVQAIRFSEASAARTESTRYDTRAGQLVQIDIALFTDWLAAVSADAERGVIPPVGTGDPYEPVPDTLSGFLFERMREEFRPALDAWIASRPLTNPDAPPSPFAMDEYVVADALTADALVEEAEEKGQLARQANQNADNYVLTTVMFATVLFFAGISSKLVRQRNRYLAFGFGLLVLLVAAIIVLSFPIEI